MKVRIVFNEFKSCYPHIVEYKNWFNLTWKSCDSYPYIVEYKNWFNLTWKKYDSYPDKESAIWVAKNLSNPEIIWSNEND